MGPSLQFLVSLAVSSFVAGAATAPFSAMHFNTFSTVSFLANVSAVPVMSLVVAQSAVAAMVGLSHMAFVPMEWGIQWILGVADYFAQWPGVTKPIITPTPWTGLAVTAAGLLLALWQGPYGRGAGMLCCGLAAAGWLVAERPDILISRDAPLVGVMMDNGRAISKARGDQFTADIWAENDGRPVARYAAHALWQTKSPKVIHIWSKKQTGTIVTCTSDQIVVSAVDITLDGPCLWITQDDTNARGAAEIYRDGVGNLNIIWAEDTEPKYTWVLKNSRRARSDG